MFRIHLSPDVAGAAPEITVDPKNPNFTADVLAEVKRFGADTKELYTSLRNDVENMKSAIARGADKSVVEKLTEAIAVKQASIDAANARVDAIETAMQRRGAAAGSEMKSADVELFTKSVLAARVGGGANFSQYEKASADYTPAFVDAYCKMFAPFLRKGEDFVTMHNMIDAKVLSTTQDPDGGYTVTPTISSRIIEKLYETDPIRQLAASETISGSSLEFMVDRDEAASGWEGEMVANAETSTPQIGKRVINVHTASARPKISQQLLEDSGINIENWLADKVSAKLLRTESAAFVTGDGVSKPRGFLTYANGTTYGTIEQVATGAAAALTTDGFINLFYSLNPEYSARATFLMNRLAVRDAMKLKDGDGQYLWRAGLAAGQPSTILGAPVRMSTTMPVVAAGALSVVLADWSRAYMIVDRLGITVQRDPFTSKPLVEFYTRKRVGGDVTDFDAIKISVVSA